MAKRNYRSMFTMSVQAMPLLKVNNRSGDCKPSRKVKVSIARQAPAPKTSSKSIFRSLYTIGFNAKVKQQKPTRRDQRAAPMAIYSPIAQRSATTSRASSALVSPDPTGLLMQYVPGINTKPRPHPEEPKIPENYIADSTSEELVLDSLAGVSTYMRDASISRLRPELIASLDWLPTRNDKGYHTSIERMLDFRWYLRQLVIDNVHDAIELFKEEDPEGTYTALKEEYDNIVNNSSKELVNAMFETLMATINAKKALDIKDNSDILSTSIAKYFSQKNNPGLSSNLDTSVKAMLTNSMKFSEEGYARFSNSKIINQVLHDLLMACQRHSPLLISSENFDRIDDLDSLKINKQISPRNKSFKFRIQNIGSKNIKNVFNPTQYSRYSSFLSSLPIDDADRIKVLLVSLSRELTISAGIGALSEYTIGKRFGADKLNASNAVVNALGRPRDNILDSPGPAGSIADYVHVESKNREIVLPFETRAFSDNKGNRSIPGSVAYVDNILRFGKEERSGFSTKEYSEFAKNFNSTSSDVVKFIEKLLNLDDENFVLHPHSVFIDILSRIKELIDGISNTSLIDEELAVTAALLNMSKEDQELKHMLLRYLIEIRDTIEDTDTDTSTDERVTPSRNRKSPRRNTKKKPVKLTRVNSFSPYMSDLTQSSISKNLLINLGAAERLFSSSKNPIATTGMRIAVKASKIADNVPSIESATSGRDANSIKISRSSVYSVLQSAVSSPRQSKNIMAVIVDLAKQLEESAAEIAAASNDSSYLDDNGVTLFNGWDEDTLLMVLLEIFCSLFSRYVSANFVQTHDNSELHVLYNYSNNKNMLEALGTISELAIVDSPAARARQTKLISTIQKSGSLLSNNFFNKKDNKRLSRGAALSSLKGNESSATLTSDIQSFISDLERETVFVNQMLSFLQALSSTLETASEQLTSFFDLKSDTRSSTTKDSLLLLDTKESKKFLRDLNPQQFILLNAAREKLFPRNNDGSYLPADQVINENELSAVKAFASEAIMSGRVGDNIRTLAVGIPAELIDALYNPPYTLGSKESTEIASQQNIIEILVYKRDLEYEDLVFKPKKYLFDISMFLLPNAFSPVADGYKFSSYEDVIKNATFSRLKIEKQSDNDFESEETATNILESGVYDYLGTGQASKMLSNHMTNFLLRKYYQLLFGYEFDENTFIQHDIWSDLIVDDGAANTLKIMEANEKLKYWVRNGTIPVASLLQKINIDGESRQRVLTLNDTATWIRPRVTTSPRKARKQACPPQKRVIKPIRKRKSIQHRVKTKKRYSSISRSRVFKANRTMTKARMGSNPMSMFAGMFKVGGKRGLGRVFSRRYSRLLTSKGRIFSKYHRLRRRKYAGPRSRTYVIANHLTTEDLNNFRALCSSGLFSRDAIMHQALSPKLFDRVFLLPVDPDDFEVDIDATQESASGKGLLNQDMLSEMLIDVEQEDGRVVKMVRPRRRGENYSSFNEFFVAISTPSSEEI